MPLSIPIFIHIFLNAIVFGMSTDLLQDILPYIKNAVFPERFQVSDWKMKEGNIVGAESPAFSDRSWMPVRIPLEWGKYDKTFWFRQTVKIPAEFAGKAVSFLSDFNEAQLYVNGEPYFGLDQNHREVLLTEKARANQEFLLAIEACSGKKSQHSLFSRAVIATFSRTAGSLAAALELMHELVAELDEELDEAKSIGDAIQQSLKFLKWFDPKGEAYPAQIERAYDYLLKKIESNLKSTLPGLIYALPTSHLDFDWLWTRGETVRKTARTVSSALRMLESYPSATFSFSQPAQYDLLQTQYPGLFKQVRQRVLEGRWEPIGAAWVEHDAQLLSGESLVRQIQFGKKYWKEAFGVDSTVAWLPDSFGFNGNLPQILQKAGVTYFYTAKLRWNDSTTFPHTSFWWEGIDGTRILSHVSPLNVGAEIAPRDLHITSGEFSPERSFDAALHVFGHGDGGGGVSAVQLERISILKNIAGISPLQLTTVRNFFADAELHGKELPVWKGELYLEKHRGVFSNLAWMKKEVRTVERLLYQAESLATLALVVGQSKKYPAKALQDAWRRLLTNQFHDLIGGTSIQDAYKGVRAELESTAADVNALIEASAKSFIRPAKTGNKEFHFTVFNPAGHTRSEYVEVSFKSSAKHFSVINEIGTTGLSQLVAHDKKTVTLLVFIEALAPFSFANYTVLSMEPSAAANSGTDWKIGTHGIETPIYRIRFDNKGTLSSVYDKKIRKELIVKGKRANLLQCYRDMPKEWEAWDIDSDFDRHRVDILSLKGLKFVESGPLRATVRLEFKSVNGSSIVQRIRLYHAVQRIDFQTNVQWKEEQVLLKVIFPVNVKSNWATYEIPFGAIRRSTKHKTDEDKAKFEVPALQWADLSDQKFGVSVLNDSKHGYDAKDGTLRLTLLRSARAVHLTDPKNRTEASVPDQGEHSFTYSLYSHGGDWRKGSTVLAARSLNLPLAVFASASGMKLPPLVQSSRPNIVVSAIKKAEEGEGIVLRVYESNGEQTDCVLTFAATVKSAEETDLLELNPKELKAKKEKLPLHFKPFEIKTLKLELKSLKLK